MSQNYVLSGH